MCDQRARPAATGDISAWLAVILDASDDAIVRTTMVRVITSWNRAAERMFGYTAAESIGQHVVLLLPPDRMAEENEVLLIDRWGGSRALPRMPKSTVADAILDEIVALRAAHPARKAVR